ncbi:MAG: carboxymuconolactone decarboxylase family protein [Planctomycetes bacterium]|nr:carboxymuconolactone decarboxylase family protein [Planctomycetota bacterium]
MARLPIQNTETATGSNKDIFAALQKGLGMVPNMAKVMANSPAVLQSFAQFNGAMGTAKLSGPIREQIALLTAENNDCTYCLSAHSALGKMSGLNQAQMDGARHAKSTDARTLGALTFAQAVIDQHGGIGTSEINAVRAAGFSDGEIAEIVAAVALNFFTNFFNKAFDVDVDFPRVEAHGHAAALPTA